ncbi:hypothetical protein AB0H49_24575 [Nocardia sp. NPDC050713]|uniref:hypothetical protein n=1 Tax=Nocardia sp. NPDC050713 TaxID=3154511 RepID=UPI00340BD2AC
MYDVASHLHKIGYLPEDQEAFLAAWTAAETEAAIGEWLRDLRIYLEHERVKSVIVDAVRYSKVIAQGSADAAREEALVASVVGKSRLAREVGRPSRSMRTGGNRSARTILSHAKYWRRRSAEPLP